MTPEPELAEVYPSWRQQGGVRLANVSGHFTTSQPGDPIEPGV